MANLPKSLFHKDRHDYILKKYILQNTETKRHKRDIDIIKDHHRFLWSADEKSINTWEEQLARRYYDKLFKEYCIADLTRYKENKLALRWRIESEVVLGIGQFQCGSRKCEERENLRSWEVNFAYKENGKQNNALVKLRLCPVHSDQLNYSSKKREVKRLKKTQGIEKSNNKIRRKKDKYSKLNIEEENLEDVLDKPENESATSEHILVADETDNTCDDNVWNRKLDIDIEPTSREADFEKYLEDMLL